MRLLVAFVFLPFAAFAQASIQGLVLDPSGAAIPDASIAVTLDATGAVRTARTAADGRYRIPALSVGSYTIRCEKPGFRRTEIPQVYLALNQTLEQNLQLKLASAGSTIDVREQPEAINTTAPTAGTGISGETLEETPSQSRSYLGVVLLAPGVAPAAGSNALRTKAGVRSASPDVKRNSICKFGLLWQSKVQTGLYQTWGRDHPNKQTGSRVIRCPSA